MTVELICVQVPAHTLDPEVIEALNQATTEAMQVSAWGDYAAIIGFDLSDPEVFVSQVMGVLEEHELPLGETRSFSSSAAYGRAVLRGQDRTEEPE